jgi:hypothetical protein
MIRPIAFCAGLALASAAQAQSLCVNGHPVPRSSHVTYGYVHCSAGYVRDHKTPLCGGGPDIAENIRCEEYGESKIKDGEEREWCEAMCRGDVTAPELQRHFHDKWDGKP